jgi:L,D-transpeptidase catalytic domain
LVLTSSQKKLKMSLVYFQINTYLIMKLSIQILTILLSLSFIFNGNLATRAENYTVPTKACELSKNYPTVVYQVSREKPLTQAILLVGCQVETVFPVITAKAGVHTVENKVNGRMEERSFYTPVGQFTFDYAFMRRTIKLSWPEAGYKDLVTPNWMPYMIDTSTGDEGEYTGRNAFGFHGAPWRYSAEFYGNAELLAGGSHGCSNMRVAHSDYLYKTLEKYRNEDQKVKIFAYL